MLCGRKIAPPALLSQVEKLLVTCRDRLVLVILQEPRLGYLAIVVHNRNTVEMLVPGFRTGEVLFLLILSSVAIGQDHSRMLYKQCMLHLDCYFLLNVHIFLMQHFPSDVFLLLYDLCCVGVP